MTNGCEKPVIDGSVLRLARDARLDLSLSGVAFRGTPASWACTAAPTTRSAHRSDTHRAPIPAADGRRYTAVRQDCARTAAETRASAPGPLLWRPLPPQRSGCFCASSDLQIGRASC